MIEPDEKLTTLFATQVHAIEATAQTREETIASLLDLKTILPSEIDPEEEHDLLFVAGNVAVAGLVNLNDDGLDIETALTVYPKFKNKFVDVEHNRKKVVGFIISVGLSEFGTNRVITEDEARSAGKPFNITTVAALWKVVDKGLCEYIVRASNPAHPDYLNLSLSFEMGFSSYYIISLPLGEREIAKATRAIRFGEPDFAKFKKGLRAYKGKGMSPANDNERVYRIMPPDVVPLGEGIVAVPAAAVEGIIAIEDVPSLVTDPSSIDDPIQADTESADEMSNVLSSTVEEIPVLEAEMTLSTAYAKSLFNTLCDKLEQSSVSLITTNSSLLSQPIMDTKTPDIKALKLQAAAATKIEDLQVTFASAVDIVDLITKKSEELEAKAKAQENATAAIEQAKQEALASNAQLQKDLDAVKTQLTEVKVAQESAAASARFEARMGALENEFELDDDIRSVIVQEVRDCAADEQSFAKLNDKFKKLKFAKKGAKKDAKDAKADDDGDDDDATAKKIKAKMDKACAALAVAGVKVKLNDELDFIEIIASAERIDATLPNGVEANESLKELAAKAFGSGMTIGGKTIDEWNK